MANIAQINDTQVSILNFNSVPVLTTEKLATFYGTENIRIQQNHSRNLSRFIEGKHFFKLIGDELRAFKKALTSLKIVSQNAKHLILWTERGAARHAKMLDTDQAWDVFEQLEDCYFHRQEILAKTHKSERTALHDAHSLLITKTKHLNCSDAWKMINQRFNTNSIDEIPFDAIPVAVEYVHHLIAMYSAAEKQAKTEPWHDATIQRIMYYMPKLHKYIANEVYPALKVIQSGYASELHGFSQDVVVSVNALNRLALESGMTHLNHFGNLPVHRLEWYLSNRDY